MLIVRFQTTCLRDRSADTSTSRTGRAPHLSRLGKTQVIDWLFGLEPSVSVGGRDLDEHSGGADRSFYLV